MNNLSDFRLGTQVIYRYNDGRIDLGTVQACYGENIRIQWSQEDEGDYMDYQCNNPHILLVSSLLIKQTSNSEVTVVKSEYTTEDKIKELIVHLVQVNQTNRACEVIEVLRKHVNDQTLNGYKLK